MNRTFTLLIVTFLLFSFSSKNECEFALSLKQFEKSMVYVPEGYDISFSQQQGGRMKVNWKEDSVKVSAFYMCSHEVSNYDYLLFLHDLKKHDTSLYHQMLPDTLIWRSKLSFNEPYLDYYLRHPAYRNYPVVGVTYEQANYYCKWLTRKYKNLEKGKFRNAEFKLPATRQWEYAAKGGNKWAVFPWGDYEMQNKKGEWLANFQVISQAGIVKPESYKSQIANVNKDCNIDNNEYLIISREDNLHFIPNRYKNSDVTAPVISYYPNKYGIYNMAGNVEEYVLEKGITKGGSWMDTGYYLMNSTQEHYDSTNYTSSERGFRFIMEIKN